MQNVFMQPKRRTSVHRRLALLSLLWAVFCIDATTAASAQTITIETTRVEAFEWICEDANGVEISRHTRQDKAQTSCTNRAIAEPGVSFFIRPSAYEVVATENIVVGAVTLNWVAPSKNTDGTDLTDLAGYKVYYGTQSGNYPNVVAQMDPINTNMIIEGLAIGTYYFVATAINVGGEESMFSGEAQKQVN